MKPWRAGVVALVFLCAGSVAPAQGDLGERFERWSESLDLDRPAEVLPELQALIAADGPLATDARAIALCARALTASDRSADAEKLLAAAGPAKPQEAITAARARLALDADDLDGVLALLWDVEGKKLREPAANDAHLLAGQARARLGQWNEAVPLLKSYVTLEPRSREAAAAWHLLAIDAARRQDAARVRECAQREEGLGRWHSYYRARLLQVREHPLEPLPRLGLAQLWLEADDVPRARRVLDDLLRIAPNFARGWLALGETQRKGNDLAGARASYDRALELEPSLAIARYNRAVIARLEGRDDEAVADFETLLAGDAGRDPRFANAHLDLARLFQKRGDQERAAACFARYAQLGGKEKL